MEGKAKTVNFNTLHIDVMWERAYFLSVFTIVFNIAEGLVSVFFGVSDEALTLFGFGMDSFIETISAAGVLVMIRRIRSNPGTPKSRFEVTALRITGWCFFALSAILAAGAALNLIKGTQPESTLAGVIISLISITSMLWLIRAKKTTGRKLRSEPLIADANCNLVCVYMSLVLLASSAAYEIFGLGWIDTLGTAGIIYFSVREGVEAFKKAGAMHDGCTCEEKTGRGIND